MFPLISLTTQFLLFALVLTAVALGATVGLLYLRVRRAEEDERLASAERTELMRRDQEIASIRGRIEDIYRRQQAGSQTQQAVINQRMEKLQDHLKARTRQIEGIQSHLQYERQERERELNQLRSQLREAVEMFQDAALAASTARALPEAQPPPEHFDAGDEDGSSHDVHSSDGAFQLEDLIVLDASTLAGSERESVSLTDYDETLPLDEAVETQMAGDPSRVTKVETGSEGPWTAVDLQFDLDSELSGAVRSSVDEASTPGEPARRAPVPPSFQPLGAVLEKAPGRAAGRSAHDAGGDPAFPAESAETDHDEIFGDLIQWTNLADTPVAHGRGAAPAEEPRVAAPQALGDRFTGRS